MNNSNLEECELTQDNNIDESTTTATSIVADLGTTDPQVWGLLRQKGGEGKEYRLEHRIKNGIRDLYVIGRNPSCDIVIEDRCVSNKHCMIYCDYSEPKLRVFLEDCSCKYLFFHSLLVDELSLI